MVSVKSATALFVYSKDVCTFYKAFYLFYRYIGGSYAGDRESKKTENQAAERS